MRLGWIDEQLSARGLPRRALADAIPTLNETKLSRVMAGERRITVEEADAIRRFFGYRLPDDPSDGPLAVVHDQIARLGDNQLAAVALYLEALSGNGPEQQRAS